MAAPNLPWVSLEEFLDLEEHSETKHMYQSGLVTAMAGGSLEHARVASNLAGELYRCFDGRDCFVVGSDVLFQTGSRNMLVYPDLMVICGPAAKLPGRPNVVTNPVFLAEVLSPGTEAKDRGEKSREYRLSPTLRQYALVAQDKALIEIHTRHEDGSWRITEVEGLPETVAFSSIECQIPMAAIYRGVLETPSPI